MLFPLHHNHSFCLVMCVFTSSTLLLYLYKRRSDIELKDLVKSFSESPNVLFKSHNPTLNFDPWELRIALHRSNFSSN